MSTRRRLVCVHACLVMAGHLAGAVAADAQERPRPVVEASGGWIGFADDGVVSEAQVGGAARWYLHPRFAIGPEVLLVLGDDHSHVVITGNVTWDLRRDAGRRPGRITPFLVAGGGLFQTRQTFFGDAFTSTEGAFTAGGGLRTHVSDRVTVGVDARVGWEPHLRIGGFIGIALGR